MNEKKKIQTKPKAVILNFPCDGGGADAACKSKTKKEKRL